MDSTQVTEGSYYSDSGYIHISGGTSYQRQWSAGIIGHEYGHYLMSHYAKHSLQGGNHADRITGNNTPRFAFSEGWATFFAQNVIRTNSYTGIGDFDIETPLHTNSLKRQYSVGY